MFKHIAAIILIFFGISIAWMVLGSSVESRTQKQDSTLKTAVGQLWGASQRQMAPRVWDQVPVQRQVQTEKDGKTVYETKTELQEQYWPLDSSRIKTDLQMEHRKKGLLWYATYQVKFGAQYHVINDTDAPRNLLFDFQFPNSDALYDDFSLLVGGKEIKNIDIKEGKFRIPIRLGPNQAETVAISYRSQGLDEWWYDFGENVNQVRNFQLVMHTNFKNIDFPQNSISPSQKTEAGQGWTLQWDFNNLLTGVKIGMSMPHKLNPGPWVANVSYFAPVSLFLFLFMVLIFSVMKGVKIHPVNYFFICAAYFSFHLLLAYLVDHISIHAAFLISSLVSIFLVVSYMRLVVGNRFAFAQVGISQFVFLVVFSYTFFFKGYTGLTVTVLSILTLFIAMQLTARVDWDGAFKPEEGPPKMLNQ